VGEKGGVTERQAHRDRGHRWLQAVGIARAAQGDEAEDAKVEIVSPKNSRKPDDLPAFCREMVEVFKAA